MHSDEHGAVQRRARDAMEDDTLKEALDFFSRFVGCAEIINEAGELERVFFQFPELCLSLSDERKTELEWKVDRVTPGAQLIDFIEAAAELRDEMVYEHALKRIWLWRIAGRHHRLAANSIFSLAVLANLLLVIRSQYCTEHDGAPRVWSNTFCSASAQRAVNHFNATQSDAPVAHGYFSVVVGSHIPRWEHDVAFALQVLVFTIGVLMSLAAIIIFMLDALKTGGPRVRNSVKAYVQHHHIPGLKLDVEHASFDEIIARVHESPWLLGPWFYPLCLWFFLANGQILFHMASFAATLIGLTVSPFWLAFGLLDFAGKSPEIRIVASALMQNMRSIVMTVVFMVIVIYIFSVVGYLYLAEYFFYMDFSEEAVPICTSLMQCFISVIDYGLRSNDIGSNVEPLRTPDIEPLSVSSTILFYLQSLYTISVCLPQTASLWTCHVVECLSPAPCSSGSSYVSSYSM